MDKELSSYRSENLESELVRDRNLSYTLLIFVYLGHLNFKKTDVSYAPTWYSFLYIQTRTWIKIRNPITTNLKLRVNTVPKYLEDRKDEEKQRNEPRTPQISEYR